MSNKYRAQISSLEPTPREVFFNRREFMTAMGSGIALAAGGAQALVGQSSKGPIDVPFQRPEVFPTKRNEKYKVPDGLPTELTPRRVAATHNNFYEFLPGRGGPVWEHIGDFEVEPWKLEIAGECNKPMTLDLDDLFGFAHEERLYHFRCVERWAMNVPWSGFPLRKLIEKVEPKSSAKYVTFTTVLEKDQMPGVREADYYPWPYFEGLRIEEATNELAFAVTGVYGEPLLRQHGSPIRIAVPWKYGYKNPKSIVRIELTKKEPKVFWQIQPHEYGFLSNVNPYIPHPRWSQAESYWLGSSQRFETPIFNGYSEYVAGLYPDEPKTLQRALRQGQVAR